MVGEGALVGRSSAKQGRVPALPLHIQHGQVADAPILWCPRAATEHEAERNVELASHVLLGAEICPETEVVDKVQKVIVCAVADDWREHFAQEAALDPAKPTASVDIGLLVVLAILAGVRVQGPRARRRLRCWRFAWDAWPRSHKDLAASTGAAKARIPNLPLLESGAAIFAASPASPLHDGPSRRNGGRRRTCSCWRRSRAGTPRQSVRWPDPSAFEDMRK